MSYTVLARRYRSQSFDEVVGQEAIARTLKNAIEQDRVAHAYLFIGTRGVGKTSMARLLAKALNDGSPEVNQAIMAGQDTDVVEIDAASNRGVEEARDLIANCIYRPMRGPYKIYIIDEVHMLTREAFNALLKTMEEPPSHVKFILCTTEPHKVPPTIQSRCQRFDFCNISTEAIAQHLTSVIESESMKADTDLARAIASLAAGSMRDGLSLLDRVMAAVEANETMTLQLLENLLGMPPRQALMQLVEALAEQNPRTALEQAAQLLSRGVSIEQVIDSIIAMVRDLMVLAACGVETDLVDLTGEPREQAAALANRFTPAGLVHMIGLCESIARSCKTSSNPRALFDALVVRLAMTEHVAEVAALLRSGAGSAAPSPSRSTQKKSNELKAGPARVQPGRPAAARPTAATATKESASSGGDDWSKVCQAASDRPTARVLTQALRPVSIGKDCAVLTADEPHMLAHAGSQTELLASLFTQALGRPMRVELVGESSTASAPPANIANDPILENEIVRKAISLFDARVVGIEKATKSGKAD